MQRSTAAAALHQRFSTLALPRRAAATPYRSYRTRMHDNASPSMHAAPSSAGGEAATSSAAAAAATAATATQVVQLRAVPLTAEAFRPFGQVGSSSVLQSWGAPLGRIGLR